MPFRETIARLLIAGVGGGARVELDREGLRVYDSVGASVAELATDLVETRYMPTGYYTEPLTFTSSLDNFEARAGYRPDVFMWYLGFAFSFPTANVAAVAARGQQPMINWMPDVTGGANPSTNANIIAGTWDTYLDTYAAAVKAYGSEVWLRLGFEMNGNGWFQWQDTDFIGMWNHVRARFTAAGATNVKWVWSPNVIDPSFIPLVDVFPGADAIDIAGMDGYNWGTSGAGGHTIAFQPFRDIFDATIVEIRALAPGKPLWVTETASAEEGGDKAAWIIDAMQQAVNYALDGLIWFDAFKPPNEPDFRISSSPAAQAAYQAATPVALPTNADTLNIRSIAVDDLKVGALVPIDGKHIVQGRMVHRYALDGVSWHGLVVGADKALGLYDLATGNLFDPIDVQNGIHNLPFGDLADPVALTSASPTRTGALADVAGLELSFDVPKRMRVEIRASILVSSTAANDTVEFRISDVSNNDLITSGDIPIPAAFSNVRREISETVLLDAGTWTYKIRARRVSGTGNAVISGFGTSRSRLQAIGIGRFNSA